MPSVPRASSPRPFRACVRNSDGDLGVLLAGYGQCHAGPSSSFAKRNDPPDLSGGQELGSEHSVTQVGTLQVGPPAAPNRSHRGHDTRPRRDMADGNPGTDDHLLPLSPSRGGHLESRPRCPPQCKMPPLFQIPPWSRRDPGQRARRCGGGGVTATAGPASPHRGRHTSSPSGVCV